MMIQGASLPRSTFLAIPDSSSRCGRTRSPKGGWAGGEEREAARKSRDYARADQLRADLKARESELEEKHKELELSHEALDDAETAADARAVVVLVEQHTGIRLV